MIKFDELMVALQSVNKEISVYYNKNRNELVYDFGTYFDESVEEFDDNDKLILLFSYFTKKDYRIMEKFISELENEELQSKLYNEINRAGAFRNFRKLIEQELLLNEWYKFRDEEYEKIVIKICEENNVKYEK